MNTRNRIVAAIVPALLWVAGGATVANGQAPLTEPQDLTAIDKPNDNGRAILVTWKKMPFEGPDVLYEVLVSEQPDGPFWPQGKMTSVPAGKGETVSFPLCELKSDYPASFGFAEANEGFHAIEMDRYDASDAVKPVLVERGREYYFKLNTIRDEQVVAGSQVVSATPVSNWFAWHKLNVMIAMIVLSAIVMAAAKIAKMNPDHLFIRRIGGLEAVDDALGRAAEMGRPVFFCHGPGGLSEVVTLSAINLLGKIAERVAEYGVEMKVTCMNYYVMQVSQEMVKDAYIRVGRPDAYRDEDVFFVSANTFAYSAAVGGMMIREKAGTAFFFGRFGSESLLLAETGAITKAIQIAGTDSFTQIPFFITTCDYTLIAEEMYAASAYLSREPRLVGAVKGQDVVKAVIMGIILVGAALAAFGSMWFPRLFWPLT